MRKKTGRLVIIQKSRKPSDIQVRLYLRLCYLIEFHTVYLEGENKLGFLCTFIQNGIRCRSRVITREREMTIVAQLLRHR